MAAWVRASARCAAGLLEHRTQGGGPARGHGASWGGGSTPPPSAIFCVVGGADPPARDFVSGGRCREGPRGGRERARRADMRQRASHGWVSLMLDIVDIVTKRASLASSAMVDVNCTFLRSAASRHTVRTFRCWYFCFRCSRFALACGAGACGKKMKQHHEALTDTGLGAALRRGKSTCTFAPCPREIAPES